mmetsp:Transcript_27184/g.64734  ORF Transcript_27184/g.64734 Transcript_27184/m.64734 type:complete len:232 (-) Transcript_27184:1189-1884(-)
MVGGDLAEDVRVADEAAEEVDRVHRGEAGGREHGTVVRVVEAEQHRALRPAVHVAALLQPCHDAREHGRAHLGAAAAAAHARLAERLKRVAALRERHERRLRASLLHHGGKVARVAGHPGAVDPVLELPQPARLVGQAATRGDAAAIPRADEAEEGRLRRERLQRLAEQLPAQVGRERRPLSHREDARLGAWVLEHGGDVTGGEDAGTVGRGERGVHRDESVRVEGEAAVH